MRKFEGPLIALFSIILLILIVHPYLNQISMFYSYLQLNIWRIPSIFGYLFLTVWLINLFYSRVLKKGQGHRLKELRENKVTLNESIRKYVMVFFLLSPFSLVILLTEKFVSVFEYLFVSVGVINLIATLVVIYLLRDKNLKNIKRNVYRKSYLPKPPNTKGLVVGVVGEDNESIDERKESKPRYLNIPFKSLNSNVGIVGSIDSGKTSSCIIPMIQEVISKRGQDSIVITDLKSTIIPKIEELLKSSKRSLRYINLDSEIRINPFYKKDCLKNSNYLDMTDLISECSEALLKTSGKDSFWTEAARSLISSGIVYTHVKHSYYTVSDIKNEILNLGEDSPEELIELSKERDFDEEERHNIEKASENISEFVGYSQELRTSIIATATVFLRKFDNFSVAKIFCPSEEEINIEDFSEYLGANSITVISFKNKSVRVAMGLMMKLLLNKELRKNFDYKSGMKRTNIYHFIDEYQEIASRSDAEATSTDREYGMSFILAFQSISQLEARMPNKGYVGELLNNLKTKICMNTTDEPTIKYFKSIAGEYEKERNSYTKSEMANDTRLNLSDGGFLANKTNITEGISSAEREEMHLNNKSFTRLSSFQGFIYVYVGNISKFYKIFLKPYFLPKNTPHYKVLEQTGGNRCQTLI